jgi:hypothetical protein
MVARSSPGLGLLARLLPRPERGSNNQEQMCGQVVLHLPSCVVRPSLFRNKMNFF